MVIKTVFRQRKPTSPKPSTKPFSAIYETVKFGLQEFGYYDQIRQYDPGWYFEKYKYKTGKRVTSKIAQTLLSKKKFSKSYRQFHKECDEYSGFSKYNSGKFHCS